MVKNVFVYVLYYVLCNVKSSHICLSTGNERALQDKQYFYINVICSDIEFLANAPKC